MKEYALNHIYIYIYVPAPPNVPLLRALWSLLDGMWGVLKGSWGVLVHICFFVIWGLELWFTEYSLIKDFLEALETSGL